MNKQNIEVLHEIKDALLTGKVAPGQVWKVTARPDGTMKRELIEPEVYRRGLAEAAAEKEALALTVRRKMGVSQDRLAEILGISAGTLRSWEQGRRRPTGAAQLLLRVAAAHPRIVRNAARREKAEANG